MLLEREGWVSLYVYDGLGNPTAILRDFGSPGYTCTYDPFELPTLTYNSGGTGQTQNPFLFKGGIQDRATGWVHFGNRWYNPTLGRWTQQDNSKHPSTPPTPTDTPTPEATASTTSTPQGSVPP
ncbi:RHS repeat-associated core domain-containing protein [Microbacterium oleivorans]|uniref:RHS repeat-associated core domain-containing protein n=1 Tax=Microbacterium oleivorans TaxID=273677 RepID=UPI002040D18B|nr:RHS repeat-associated core domain-containing protein [Microbacterium oleivorans]MCM3696328.1 hypothetical protein [Microbacterium oleivorans]